jgi:arsenate-mycothiol transferase
MAAGLMRKHAGGTVQVYSAGTSPGRSINELSAEALTEVGVDITEESLNSLTRNWCATSTLWSPSGERLTSTRSPARFESWDTDKPCERGIDGIERMRLVRDDIARVTDLYTRLQGHSV